MNLDELEECLKIPSLCIKEEEFCKGPLAPNQTDYVCLSCVDMFRKLLSQFNPEALALEAKWNKEYK